MTDQKKIDEARKLFEEQEIAQGRSVEMTSCGEYLDGVVFFGWLNELDRIDAEYAQAQKAAEQCETMQRPKSECGCPDCGSSLIDCPKAEPAPAQDERGAFEAEWVAKGGVRPGNYSAELDRYVSERVQGRYEGWKLARIARPAQAYPKRVAPHIDQFAEGVFVWYDEAALPGGAEPTLQAAQQAMAAYGEHLTGPDKGGVCQTCGYQYQAQDEREAFEGWADQQWPGAKRQQLERDEYSGQYKNTIYRDYWTGWQARATRPAQTAPQHSDDAAVDRFAAAMKAKLAAARAKGRGGWDDPNVCSVEFLAQLLVEQLGKGNIGTFEDVANFAMMLHQRGAEPKVLADAARPAQTEQQPVGRVFTDEERFRSDGKSGPVWWFGPLPAGAMLYAAPIAQTAPQPEQSGLRAGQVVAMCEVGHDRLERAALDTKRLEWMLAERCIIESQNGTGSPTVYRVAWPSLGEAQSEWYPTEREAIDNAQGSCHE